MYSSVNLQVLQLLWDLSHLPALSTHLVELALEEHLAILSDSYTVKDQVKRNYVSKCVEDIKKVGKQGPYSPTILKNILCLFPQDSVNLNVTQLLIG